MILFLKFHNAKKLILCKNLALTSMVLSNFHFLNYLNNNERNLVAVLHSRHAFKYCTKLQDIISKHSVFFQACLLHSGKYEIAHALSMRYFKLDSMSFNMY